MNREQVGVLAVAAITVLTLSVSASALAGLDAGSDDATGGTAVFTEDATLEDDLNPEEQDLSGSPFLEMLYELTPAVGDETNTTNVSTATGGRTSLLPFALLFGGLLVSGALLMVVGVWRLWSASRPAGSTAEPEGVHGTEDEGGAADDTDRIDPDAFGNEVYLAWYRMARAVGAGRRTSETPREVARLAIEEGMESDAVETLTREFELVRYGETDVTAKHEHRVREALSRLPIEGKRP